MKVVGRKTDYGPGFKSFIATLRSLELSCETCTSWLYVPEAPIPNTPTPNNKNQSNINNNSNQHYHYHYDGKNNNNKSTTTKTTTTTTYLHFSARPL